MRKEEIMAQQSGDRLDLFLTTYYNGRITRSQITAGIKNGSILLNNSSVKSGMILKRGDVINVNIEDAEAPAAAEDIKIDIIFEDDHLIVLNKPRGLVVHPGAGNKHGTLLNALLYKMREDDKGDVQRAGIVHRLDKNTAGLMIAAKTAAVQAKLAAMFEKHEIKRTYLGLVEGIISENGTINKNIIRDPNRRIIFKTTTAGGRRAITHYKVIKNFSKWTLLKFNLETGRTHQIRVHCKSIGHPLLCDPEYNPNSTIKDNGTGQLLESIEIEFIHPVTGQKLHFRIEPSATFRDVIMRLRPQSSYS